MRNLKICAYDTDLGERVGSVVGDRVYDLSLCCAERISAENGVLDSYRLAGILVPPGLAAFIDGGDQVLAEARRALDWVIDKGSQEGPSGEPLAVDARNARLKAPILPSTKVICMIATYPDYVDIDSEEIEEDQAPDEVASQGTLLIQAYPHYFVKMSQVVVGPEDWVVLPTHHPDQMVYGTELTVVIGSRARKVSEEEASEHIWGYTILNDLTLVGLYNPNHKVFDTCAPVGPWIVPGDQIADPGDLDISFRVNGRQTQKGNTRNLRFSVASMVAEVSKWLTLNPGDIIATGDLGTAEYLKAGDIMEAEIEGIGVLSNPVKLEEE